MQPHWGNGSPFWPKRVLYRGCAIPVAWKIVEATAKGAWQPYWLQLLDVFMGCIPSNWKVIVAADRGLYADWL
ncbi:MULTISPECIES: hypothetical protein [unclassified Microcoleus]|uniref:hypothetical protein n=1 Tax=unclassified Microcoleus TaxID=2642155 RepID=UPI002FCFE222